MVVIRNDNYYLKKLLEQCIRDDNGCLIYQGVKVKGHGRMRYHGQHVPTHRLMMHLKHGFNLDSPLQILHKNDICKSKACCEDTHLYIGTYSDNINDAIELGHEPFKNRHEELRNIIHCPKGHEYTPENTRIEIKRGNKTARHCRQCHRDDVKEALRIKRGYYKRNV